MEPLKALLFADVLLLMRHTAELHPSFLNVFESSRCHREQNQDLAKGRRPGVSVEIASPVNRAQAVTLSNESIRDFLRGELSVAKRWHVGLSWVPAQ